MHHDVARYRTRVETLYVLQVESWRLEPAVKQKLTYTMHKEVLC